jgi:selenocysteine lyase/cysteine desulfurase
VGILRITAITIDSTLFTSAKFFGVTGVGFLFRLKALFSLNAPVQFGIETTKEKG